MGWLERADTRDNTPWWLPNVTVTGAGDGVLVQRCDPFGYESGGPRHLEGGFYGLDSLGPHLWQCKARADARYKMTCRCGHAGRPAWLCNGHAAVFHYRMSGVCPPCVHPARELEIQAAMASIRNSAPDLPPTMAAYAAAQDKLWDLQDQLNELVKRGIVHRCRVRLVEVS